MTHLSPRDGAVLDALAVGVVVLTGERVVEFANRRALDLLELPRDELVGCNLRETWEFTLPSGDVLAPSAPAVLGPYRKEMQVRDLLVGVRPPGRSRLWTIIGLNPILGHGGEVSHLAIHFSALVKNRDELTVARVPEGMSALIDQRSAELVALESKLIGLAEEVQTTESALRQTEALYRSVIDAMAEGVAIHETNGAIRTANPAAERILGLSLAQLQNRAAVDRRWQLIDDVGLPMAAEDIPSEVTARTGEACHRRSLGVNRADGSRAWLEVSTRPLGERGPEPARRFEVVATFTDVTVEYGARRALEKSRGRFASVLEAIPGVLYQYLRRPEGTHGFEFISASTSRLLGVDPEAVLADPDALFSLVHRGDVARSSAALAAAESSLRVLDIPMRVRVGGEWRWFRNRAVPEKHPEGTLWSGVLTDITEERQLAQQLRSAQTRETIAAVTSGVAHNFNNALAAIIPNLEEALVEASGSQLVSLEEALKTAEAAGGLVRQLMVIANPQPMEESPSTRLSDVVGDVVSLCGGLFGGQVRIVDRVERDRALVAGDPARLHQMALNLCINARHAMTGVENPVLTVELARATRDAIRGLRLSVRDNGSGMNEATQHRLGEPFFTTKPPGMGTGLGLATTYATVRELGGSVECESTVGEGTEFVIWLPSTGASAASIPAPAREPLEVPEHLRSVILIDDEPLVRRALARALRRRGWQVDEASDGQEALSRVAAANPPYSAAVLDLSMPGLSGVDVLAHWQRTQPELPVLILSGLMPDRDRLAHAVAVLQKPIPVDELVLELDRAVAEAERRDL